MPHASSRAEAQRVGRQPPTETKSKARNGTAGRATSIVSSEHTSRIAEAGNARNGATILPRSSQSSAKTMAARRKSAATLYASATMLPAVKSLVAVSVRQTTANRVQRRPGSRRLTIQPASRQCASQIAEQRTCSAQIGYGVAYAIAEGRRVKRRNGLALGAKRSLNQW